MYLVDTNVLSELSKPRPDGRVIDWFDRQQSLAVSAITVEELAFGIERSVPEKRRRLARWFEQLMAIPPKVVVVDEQVARVAGRLRAEREQAGRMVPQADLLVAACALSTGRTLVTRNVKHFVDCGVPLFNPFSEAD